MHRSTRRTLAWGFLAVWQSACGTEEPTEMPPVGASITIEGGAEVTDSATVELDLSAQGAVTVEISELPDLSAAKSLTFATTMSWELSHGDAQKTLYARFANQSGEQSEIASDSILLDTTPPKLAVNAPTVSSEETVRLEGTVMDATEVLVTVDTAPVTVTKGAFSVDVELPNEGVNSFVVVATDVVEHEASATVEITLDTIAPVVTLDTPEDGALIASSPVETTGTVDDATDVVVTVNGEPATVADGTWTALVPVSDGTVGLVATATDAAGNASASSEHTVLADLTAPDLDVIEPTSGSATRNSTVFVHGTVADATDMVVMVAGESVTPTGNGDFYAFNVALALSSNEIPVVATDAAGHVASILLVITRDETAPDAPTITVEVSGDEATVCVTAEEGATVIIAIGDSQATATTGDCATLTIPEDATQVFATAVDAAGNASSTIARPLDSDAPVAPTVYDIASPTSRRAIVVYGFAEPGSIVYVTGGLEEVAGNAHDDTGFFFLGVKLKTNRLSHLSVWARDAAGNGSSATPLDVRQDELAGDPARLVTLVGGQSQRQIEERALALPLDVMVCDQFRQPIQEAVVHFQVVGGDGSLGELTERDVVSDASGRADATLTVGPAGEVGDQLVLVDVEGNEGPPVLFDATALADNPDAVTTVQGTVLGNDLEPVFGATVTMQGGSTTLTDSDGRFEFTDVTPGAQQFVYVDPALAIGPKSYPPMTQHVDVWEGQTNDLGKPIFLPDLDTASAVDASEGGTARSALYDDLTVSIAPGQVTLPYGAVMDDVMVSSVPSMRVPMPLTGGMGSDAVISIVPANALFDPPAAVTFPNLDGLPPGSPAQLVSFDHDEGRYKVVGTATVSEDGSTVSSDPGSGIRKGAWHAVLQERTAPVTAAECKFGSAQTQGSKLPVNNMSVGGEPVELAGGSFLYEKVDVSTMGRHLFFQFERFYSSKLDYAGPLGHGWTHSYNQHLAFSQTPCTVVGPVGTSQPIAQGDVRLVNIPVSNPSNSLELEIVCPPHADDQDVTYFDSQARMLTFRALGGGAYESPAGLCAKLEQDGSELVLTRSGGLVEHFDKAGRLRSIQDRHGDKLRFDYDEARLVAVADPLGRVFRLGYDDADRIVSITDYTFFRTWRYAYNTSGDLVSITVPATAEFPNGTTVQYAYTAGQSEARLNHNLESITNERGITWLQNTYGTIPGSYSFDKVTSQLHAADLTTFEYQPLNTGAPSDLTIARNLTRVVDGNGNIRDTLHNENGHEIEARFYANRRVHENDPPVFITRRTYTAAGQLATTELPRGNRLAYFYDETNDDPCARSNLLRVEAQSGELGVEEPIVHSWTYEPRFQLLQTETSALGVMTTYTFDYDVPGGNIFGDVVRESHFVTVDGETTEIAVEMQYDSHGQLTHATDPEGNVKTFEYFSETDPTGTGKFIRAKGDSETGGFLKTLTVDAEHASLVTTYSYDQFGRMNGFILPSETPPVRQLVTEYDELDRIVRAVDPAGTETRFEYDAAGNLTRQEQDITGDENAAELGPTLAVEYDHDELGRVTEERHWIDADPDHVAVTSFTYDAAGHMNSVRRPEGLTTTYAYDERDLLASVTAGPRTSTLSYDANGNVTEESDSGGHKTHHEYDSFDRLVATVGPQGTRFERELDAEAQVVAWRTLGAGVAGAATLLGQGRVIYDADGLRLRIENDQLAPDGSIQGVAISTSRYDRLGRAVTVTDPVGSTTTFEYDGVGRTVAIQDHLRNRQEMTYGMHPNPTEIINIWPGDASETPHRWHYQYDTLERPIMVTAPSGNTTRVQYNSRGMVVRTTDSLENATFFQYDGQGLGILERAELRAGGTGDGALDVANGTNTDALAEVRRTYDRDGRLIEIQGDGGGATQYTYNPAGDLETITDPLGQVVSYEYDDDGLLVLTVAASGTVSNYDYDAGHRLAAVVVTSAGELSPVAPQTFDYDGLGRMTSARDENDPGSTTDDVLVTRSYDSFGNVVGEDQAGQLIALSYDVAGRPIEVVYPDGTTETLVYDALGRPIEVAIGSDIITRDHYVGPLLVSRTYGNGATTNLTYDQNDDIASIEHRDASATLFQSYTYGYETTGEPAYVQYEGGTGDVYKLDSLGRLVGLEIESPDPAAGLSGTHSVRYDLDGDANRAQVIRDGVSTAYTSNLANQYTSVGATTQTYDADGRLLSDGTHTFSYDGHGRLGTVSGPSGDVFYQYDALGRVLTRSAGGEQTHIAYVGALPIEERDASDMVTAKYYRVGFDLFAADLAGARRYVHIERQNNITSLTDSTSTVVQRYRYEPFGMRSVLDAAGADPAETVIELGFGTQRHDAEAGLILFPARALNPETGQFTTTDPLGPARVGPNLYAHTMHSPTSLVDPMGLESFAASMRRLDDSMNVTLSSLADTFTFGFASWVEGEDVTEKAISRAMRGRAASERKSFEMSARMGAISGLLLNVALAGGATGRLGAAIRGATAVKGLYETKQEVDSAIAWAKTGSAVEGTQVATLASPTASTAQKALAGITIALQAAQIVPLFAARGPAQSAPRLMGPSAPRLMGTEDAAMKAARLIPRSSGGYANVVTHADPFNASVLTNGQWMDVNHRKLAKFIRDNGITGPVRLIACEAGQCPLGLAQKLANKLGVEVLAATEKVSVTNTGKFFVEAPGKWIRFQPGTWLHTMFPRALF